MNDECFCDTEGPTPMATKPCASVSTPTPPPCFSDCGPETVCDQTFVKILCPTGPGCACAPPSFVECGSVCDDQSCGLDGRFIVCPDGSYGEAFCKRGLGYWHDECGCASACPTATAD